MVPAVSVAEVCPLRTKKLRPCPEHGVDEDPGKIIKIAKAEKPWEEERLKFKYPSPTFEGFAVPVSET